MGVIGFPIMIPEFVRVTYITKSLPLTFALEKKFRFLTGHVISNLTMPNVTVYSLTIVTKQWPQASMTLYSQLLSCPD